jgi:hypothetical protein
MNTLFCVVSTTLLACGAVHVGAAAPGEHASFVPAMLEVRQVLCDGLRLGPWYVRSEAPGVAEKGQELTAKFRAALAAGREPAGWRRAETDADGTLHLPGPEHAQTWLAVALEMPVVNDFPLTVFIGSDGRREFWINGRLLSSKPAAPLPKKEEEPLKWPTLSAGTNVLLFRVMHDRPDPRFRFDLPARTARSWAAVVLQGYLERCCGPLVEALRADVDPRRFDAMLHGDCQPLLTAIAHAAADCGEQGAVIGRQAAAIRPDAADSYRSALALYEKAVTLRECLGRLRILETALPSAKRDLEKLIRDGVDTEDPRWLAVEQRAVQARIRSFGIEEIVFAVRQPGKDGHWYANFGYWSSSPEKPLYGEGGRLCALKLATGTVRTLLEDSHGGVRDPQVYYDGKKILFSYRKGGQPYYHLYEIQADGTGLRQITDGPYDDIEPAYLPDGGIVFCSSRCNRMVNCWFDRVATIHRCDADGSNLRMLSANLEQDNTPWVLPDGRILYQRWEYVDRSQTSFHHLWTMNPDGTGQMVYFGNMRGGTVMIDAKPIPGTNNVVASFSPGHGKREHAGFVTVIDPNQGPDDPHRALQISRAAAWRDPYPLSATSFLVAGMSTDLQLMDEQGRHMLVYDLGPEDQAKGLWIHEPRPLAPRVREQVLAPLSQPTQETGQSFVQNVYQGRNMAGIRRGDIKKLLVLEVLPKPVNFSGGQEPLSLGGTFTLERILGTVPVEADGSAYFELPALRPIFFVALDEQDLSVKRMQSFMTVQPGETVGCIGCHESRVGAPAASPEGLAMRRPPSRIQPVAGVPDVFDFPRDIQPILDRHCVACHDYGKTAQGGPRAGGVILTGDHGSVYSHSYVTLTVKQLFSDGRNGSGNRSPRSIGSSASRLLTMIDGTHYGAKLSPQEAKLLRLWIESGAPYPGTYAALGSGMVASPAQSDVWGSRCAECHSAKDREADLYFNLTRPAQSLALLAPLRSEAGGYALCRKLGTNGKPTREPAAVFTSTADADYQSLLKAITAAKLRLDTAKRFDMPGFRPNPHYLREMQVYGILPHELKETDAVDPYRVDRDYWRSHWYTARISGQ